MSTTAPPPPAAPSAAPPPDPQPSATGRQLAAPLPAIVGYTLRACLPAKRWFGVLLPCLGALLFGLLSNVLDNDPVLVDAETGEVVTEDDTEPVFPTDSGTGEREPAFPTDPGTGDPGVGSPTTVPGGTGEPVLPVPPTADRRDDLVLTESDLADADNFADVAELGLFALILPLTCLVVGDAVLGADARAGTFQTTWLSPVPFPTIAFGRWIGGWMVTLVTLVPAFALAPVIAGVPDAAGPMAVAGVFGAAAYIALFMMVGVVTRRSALWSLAIVLLGEWLLASQLDGVAQLSPLWQAQQLFAGLWTDGALIEREGIPLGWGAAVRLILVGVVCLGVAAWRLGRMRPISSAD